MYLSRQLMLLISLLFLLIFGGNFAVGVNQMRGYLLVESQVHAQDTATSLGLSLSPHLTDPTDPILETMIRAIYDRGYYLEIKLTDIDGRTLVRLADSRVFAQVPDWFIRLLPMATATATSEISSGWNLAGVVSVTINPGWAYLKLYQQMRHALFYSLVTLGLALLLLFVVLRLTLRPLSNIAQLAHDIAGGRFARIDPLPWTREVRQVAESMNFMSGKIEGVIRAMNQKLEGLNQRLLRDELTGLYHKGSFTADLEHLAEDGDLGCIVYLRIEAFAELANAWGEARTDQFLQAFATILERCAEEAATAARAYRFHGAEFALLVPGLGPAAITDCAQTLHQRLTGLGEQHGKPDLVHIGIAPFNAHDTPAGMLALAQEAFEQARLIGFNSYFIYQHPERGRTPEQWRARVLSLIAAGDFQIAYIGPVLSCRDGEVLMEEAFIHARDEGGEPIPVGPFISMAERYERIADLDRGVIRKVATRLQETPSPHCVAINLSMLTLNSVDFHTWLGEFLHQHAALAGRLIFSVSAYGVAKDIDRFRDFVGFTRRLGAKTLLKRYDVQFIPIETLKTLRPDYVRLARDLTAGISQDPDKRQWVQTMHEAGDLLEIAILAEAVREEADFRVIQELGLAGASR